jgi:hypothetical protein
MSPSVAIWSTLRHRQFRALWNGGGGYFIGNAMQVMAAAWMMVELTGSDFLAAAVQTACSCRCSCWPCRRAFSPTRPTGGG